VHGVQFMIVFFTAVYCPVTQARYTQPYYTAVLQPTTAA